LKSTIVFIFTLIHYYNRGSSWSCCSLPNFWY